ncbi:MAG: nuclear transport factor 2 family protein [Pigmentiphaga sp.]|uniref:nuclear transport factor 2 family protein n=1 Tax=Pigmentiphaga sp. TaxID=1977564 RepID=UPI0029B6C5D0|nr:nuclear transport factor 2 family protein [Pigmentiphaga sp.]MDX3905599.1 nuclear transport factor 2 family protein [Pigmentiphaga sp.]
MSVSLPDPVAAYFEASNQADIDRLASCFTPDATVYDEGRTHRGRAAIAAWQTDARKKFQFSAEPLEASRDGNRVAVAANVVGNFPGSPVELEHVFLLADDKIQSLEIR